MAPLRNIRKSRRLSRMPPMEAADYDWQGAASLDSLHTSSDVEITPSIPLAPPSPSSCTTSPSDSPPPVVTHLPFTPGSSHTRNRREGHIPRPPNAFMVFRSWLWNKDNLKSVERDNRNVSRIAGRYWNELSEAERAPFRHMAEEAKARHNQLYPDYRYSPSSQKKSKVAARRSRRDTEDETEKCKKLADLLLGGVVGRDLTKYLDEEKKEVQTKRMKGGETDAAPTFEETSLQPLHAAPRKTVKTAKASRKGPYPRQQRSTKEPKAAPLPTAVPYSQLTAPSIAHVTEDWPETSMTPGLFIGTPELQYPLLGAEEDFAATKDIPYLSLDPCDYMITQKDREEIEPPLVPSHLLPGAYSPFCGVKPEAIQFVDSFVLGAYTAGAEAPFVPLSPTFEFQPYSSCDSTRDLLDSPIYFSNPFEEPASSTTRSALLSNLDQLFGQYISPLTPVTPTESW